MSVFRISAIRSGEEDFNCARIDLFEAANYCAVASGGIDDPIQRCVLRVASSEFAHFDALRIKGIRQGLQHVDRRLRSKSGEHWLVVAIVECATEVESMADRIETGVHVLDAGRLFGG